MSMCNSTLTVAAVSSGFAVSVCCVGLLCQFVLSVCCVGLFCRFAVSVCSVTSVADQSRALHAQWVHIGY